MEGQISGVDKQAGSRRRNLLLTNLEITISLLEAFQGTTRRIEIDGRRLEVKIPRGARSGTKVRVSDAISSTDGRKNDLYLVVQVTQRSKLRAQGE